MASQEPLRLLFVCVENACRSQIAEGFARHYGGARVDAHSAGSKPRGQVDATAITVMQEKGVDISQHASKGISDLPPQIWDAIITMGCGDACPHLPARWRFDWQIPSPAFKPLEGYREIRDLIEDQVKALVERMSRQ